MRGSRDGEVPGQHLVAAYAHEPQPCWRRFVSMPRPTNTRPPCELLGILPVKGRIVTGDALFCQRDLCPKIVDQGGDYVFTVKDNQLGLKSDIADRVRIRD